MQHIRVRTSIIVRSLCADVVKVLEADRLVLGGGVRRYVETRRND